MAQLTQKPCDSSPAQKFTFTPVSGSADSYTIGTSTGGSCVDISGASGADNTTVIQYACHSGTNQQFRLQAGTSGTFNLVAVGSGKCVAPSGDSPAGGAGLVQLPCGSVASRVHRRAQRAERDHAQRPSS